MAQMRLTAVYMKVPEGYVAFVEELPGANTQGETIEGARANLEEAVTMVLDANRELSELSLQGAEVVRETLILPTARDARISFVISTPGSRPGASCGRSGRRDASLPVIA
jgi:predicted RNase H-like HicB family nuclease